MKTQSFRWTSLPLALLVLIQSLVSVPMYGLSGGPTQPEFGQPTTVGADNLVDVFSGNFQYSIPLFEIGGYPMTLSYSSDHKMEEEASWVGFGWTLNPGAISRQVRGLPDDFMGDQVTHRANMKPNVTTGISPGADVELFGYFGLSTALNFTYNNYNGFDFSTDFSPSVNLNKMLSDAGNPDKSSTQDKPISNDEADEIVKSRPKVTFPWQMKSTEATHLLSANFNSRSGLESATWSAYAGAAGISNSLYSGGITYTPTSDLPRKTSALTYNIKVGVKGSWPDAVQATLSGQKLTQELARKSMSQEAYGYLYLEHAADKPKSIMDYNVERGGLINQDATRLPIPYGTPDIYSVTGPGLSGQLEVSRRDFQPFRPAETESVSVSKGIGGDASFGNIVHVGANINASNVSSRKGGWKSFAKKLSDLVNSPPTGDEEPEEEALVQQKAYFRFIGEQSVQTNRDWFNKLGGSEPLSFDIGNSVEELTLPELNRTEQVNRASAFVRLSDLAKGQAARTPNATVVSYLTAGEAQFAGLDRAVRRYDPFTDDPKEYANPNSTVSERVGLDNERRGHHHVGEINVLNPSGQRYVYGLPVYNFEKREITFNAANLRAEAGEAKAGPQGSEFYNLIRYNPSKPRVSVNNKSGNDHYFDEVVTPAYPAAHLLTGILSPDYVDVTDDGLTEDDLGNYVKIGYSALETKEGSTAIGYRTPAGENTAILSEGNLTDPNDDKASFSYGEKEIYYVNHMDSKTHRAVFITSNRQDAIPVDRNGKPYESTEPYTRLQRLDAIKIFTLAELAYADKSNRDPVPIKTVTFNYAENGAEAQISGDLPNAEDVTGDGATRGGGKLTLLSVSFTYGNNQRGAENPYRFVYKTHAVNEEGEIKKVLYEPFMMDRWGTQRHSSANADLGPIRYPYATQDPERANAYADLGNLTRILLPSGGRIDVDYEADDYAYVQNYRAGRMYQLAGFSKEFPEGDDPNPQIDRKLYDPKKLTVGKPSLYAYIKVADEDDESLLKPNIIASWTPEELRRRFLPDVDQLYFSSMVQLEPQDTDYERITGYLGFEEDFLRKVIKGKQVYLALKLKGLTARNKETDRNFAIHPISYAALEKMRAQLPSRLYDVPGEQIEVQSMLAILKQSGSIFQNFFSWRLEKNRDARFIDPKSSFVRLAEPTFKKYGGGSRVQRITLHDNWLKPEDEANQTNGPADASMQYVKTYRYTTTDPVSGEEISSGVAANEPMNGKEEMLMVNVGKKANPKFLGPDNTYYLENPAGLAFFPGASVGYSKVTTQIDIPDEQYAQSKPGKTVDEFFTARDYPVKVSMTDPDRKTIYPKPLNLAFVSLYLSRLGISQGFTVEVNNMHGKPKASREYGHEGNPISSTIYNYKDLDEVGSGLRQLDNNVPVVITKQAAYGEADTVSVERDYLGVHASVWMEHTSDKTKTYGGGAQINADVSLPFLGVVIPWPNLTHAQSSLQTAAVTKFINRMGILEEVTVTNNGSSLSTRNHQFDALTGSAVLTSTNNEFDRPIYQHNSLAYWMAPQQGMGAAYTRTGMRWQGVSIEQGIVQRDDEAVDIQWFPGDEVYAYLPFASFSRNYRLTAVVYPDDKLVKLIDDDGQLMTTTWLGDNYKLILTRSGRRNILTASSGSVSALSEPDRGLFYSTVNDGETDVLSASATVYSDDWGNLCEPLGPWEAPEPPDPCDECDECQPCPDCPTWKEPTCEECEDYEGCPPPDCGDGPIVLKQTSPFSENGVCYLKEVTYTEQELDELEENCGCEDLFRMYADQGWLPRLTDYAECKVTDGIWGYDIRPEMQTVVDTCGFAKQPYDGEGLFSGGKVRLSTISTSQGGTACNILGPGPYAGCSVGRSRTITAGLYTAPDSGQLFETTLGYFQESQSCFPWHPKSGINPYLDGRRGNWRVSSSYVIKQQERAVSNEEPLAGVQLPDGAKYEDNDYSQPLLYKDGTLSSYHPFWSSEPSGSNEDHYQLVNEVLRYDEHGHELETQDALEIESGAQYGFLQNLPMAVAQNASHLDIGFDGFEDYAYERDDKEGNKWLRHFGMLGRQVDQPPGANIVTGKSHTGKFAYRVAPGGQGLSQTFDVFNCDPATVFCPDAEGCGDCVNGFTPRPKQKFVLSGWVASENSLAFGLVPGNPIPIRSDGVVIQPSPEYRPSARVRTANGGTLATVIPNGPVVDGWQQIQLTFDLSEAPGNLTLEFDAPSGSSSQAYYFDDIRIQPFESEMTSYVYDYSTLRLMAQLDDRGYAVFYEYDDEGMLIRQKRETERGIMTITEQHTNLAPATPQKP